MKLAVNQIKPNPDNPRTIKDDNFRKLVKSLQEFPEMAEVREVVLNKDHVILGGNMRFKAMQEAGWTEIPVRVVDWSEEKQQEFVVKDNVAGGDWDWSKLIEDWDKDILADWGLELPVNVADVSESEMQKKGTEDFAEELLLEHNYIVCYFDNHLDWQVACDKYGLKPVKDLIPRKGQPVGIGRVIDGKKIL